MTSFCGDGSDGDVIITEDTMLDRDVEFRSLRVGFTWWEALWRFWLRFRRVPTVRLFMAGYRVQVQGRLWMARGGRIGNR